MLVDEVAALTIAQLFRAGGFLVRPRGLVFSKRVAQHERKSHAGFAQLKATSAVAVLTYLSDRP